MDKRKDVKLTSMVKTSGCAAKLSPTDLHSVIDKLPVYSDERLLEGFESSDDALVYKVYGDIVAIETVDFFPPMVDDPYIFGQIAAANALSDIYAMGGNPNVAMNLLCFPSCLDLSFMEKILLGGLDKVHEAGAVIAGGHTISDPTPKYGLCVTSFMKESDVWSNKGAKEGDVLVLTKALGVGVINTAKKGNEAPRESFEAAVDSMTRLNKIARDFARDLDVHAATDVTGFSLSGHAYEVASASSVSFEIDTKLLPLLPDAEELARFGLLPEGMYNNLDYVSDKVDFASGISQSMKDIVCCPETSGGLLLSLSEDEAMTLVERISKPYASIIGRVVAKREKPIYFF